MMLHTLCTHTADKYIVCAPVLCCGQQRPVSCPQRPHLCALSSCSRAQGQAQHLELETKAVQRFVKTSQSSTSAFTFKTLVGAFNMEKLLEGAFSVIVKSSDNLRFKL